MKTTPQTQTRPAMQGGDTIDHALRLCDLLAIDLARLDDGTSDASRCAEFRLSIVNWLLFRKMKDGIANPDDGVRWDANERGQIVRSVILPDAKIDYTT